VPVYDATSGGRYFTFSTADMQHVHLMPGYGSTGSVVDLDVGDTVAVAFCVTADEVDDLPGHFNVVFNAQFALYGGRF